MNKRNGYFTACGILSIINSIVMGVSSILMIFYSSYFSMGVDYINYNYGTASMPLGITSNMFVSIGAFAVFVTAFNIFCAIIYLKHSKCTPEKITSHKGRILTAIVFSFLFDGLLVGILGVVGYNQANSATNLGSQSHYQNDSNAGLSNDVTEIKPSQSTQQPDEDEILFKKLEKIKKLKESGVLTDEEYEKLRATILSKF